MNNENEKNDGVGCYGMYIESVNEKKQVYLKDGIECYGIILHKNHGGWRISPRDLLSFLEFKYGKDESDKYVIYKAEYIDSAEDDNKILKRVSKENLKDLNQLYLEYYVSHSKYFDDKSLIKSTDFYGDTVLVHPFSFISGRYDSDFISFIESCTLKNKVIIEFSKQNNLIVSGLQLYDFKVVYVPIDVNYYIFDYDGLESVKEVSREWS